MDHLYAADLSLGIDLPTSAEFESACTATTAVLETAKAASISWMSARRENPSGREPLCIINGVMCLVFGVGPMGAEWITRLAQAEWFTGLEPQAEDLAVSGGIHTGSWTIPAANSGDWSGIGVEVKVFVERASLPSAILGTIAVPSGAGPQDLAIAVNLVGALRERRDSRGCRMTVVATVEAGLFATPELVRALQEQGAFVVQASPHASGDYLHHFPLRAPIPPPTGRMPCLDFADLLACWPPGGVSTLYVISSNSDKAAQNLSNLPTTEIGRRRIRFLNLVVHSYLDDPNENLLWLDRLADCCLESFPECDWLYTIGTRMDGVTGTADLLLIFET